MDQAFDSFPMSQDGGPDIMAIVMQRGLGKRPAPESGHSPPVAKVQKTVDAYDEPDSAAVEVSSKSSLLFNSDRIVDVKTGVEECETQSTDSHEKVGSVCRSFAHQDSTGGDEKVVDSECLGEDESMNCAIGSQPRVQMFNESDSNSNGPFAIAPFQCLNTSAGKSSEGTGRCTSDIVPETLELADASSQRPITAVKVENESSYESDNGKVKDRESGDVEEVISTKSEGQDSEINAQDTFLLDAQCSDTETKAHLKEDGGKKSSRKQNNPKRLPVPKCFAKSGKQISAADDSQDNVMINSTDEENSESDKTKAEKSRKQFKPQRILQTFGQHLSGDLKRDEDLSDSEEGNTGTVVQDVDGHCEVKIEADYNEDSDETYYSTLASEMNFKATPNTHSYDIGEIYRNLGQYTAMLPSPGTKYGVLDKLAWQNEMLLSLTQNLFQAQRPGTAAAAGSAVEENLDIVRKLREIRFHRYRKITIAEKKEIADFAKLNGVSAAAGHYGVSKSAVSMWTRTDFTDMDDDSKKRKKNCMLGNQKFEELVIRVKMERANKFKGLSKLDKFEVSRYAKLVGVREMARCLDVALGTVSGWMRQYPYTVETASQEEGGLNVTIDETESNVRAEKDTLEMLQNEDESSENYEKFSDKDTEKGAVLNASMDQDHTRGMRPVPLSSDAVSDVREKTNSSVEGKTGTSIKTEFTSDKVVVKQERDANVECLPSSDNGATIKTEFTSGKVVVKQERTDNVDSKPSSDDVVNNTDTEGKIVEQLKDDVDKLIAENLQQPDIDKCFENIQDMIYGSPLQDDKAFELLFRRVLACRSDKYKYLKASEKLEVVRYAKQNGVRKMAKILGLATGTLSGWNTKYQSHLNLQMDDSLTSVNANSSSVCEKDATEVNSGTRLISESFGNVNVSNTQSPSMLWKSMAIPSVEASTPSVASSPAAALLDNPEKSEVLAIKYLMKDKFAVLVKKIEIARKIKFRNISREEKVEIVKCAKLVGIRPTARVLNMPIGTLSGWITKYSNELHPVYHVSQEETADGFIPPSDLASLANMSPLLNPEYAGLVNTAYSPLQRGLPTNGTGPYMNSASLAMAMNGMPTGMGTGIDDSPQEMRHYAEMLKAFSETSVNFSEMAKQQHDTVGCTEDNGETDTNVNHEGCESSTDMSHVKDEVVDDDGDVEQNGPEDVTVGDEGCAIEVGEQGKPCLEAEAEQLARQYIKAAYGDAGVVPVSPAGV